MTIAIFDTLKLATKLEESGFTPDQAKGAAAALAEAFNDDLVTKAYLDDRLEVTKTHLDARLEVTKTYLDTRLEATKTYLDTRLEATKTSLDTRLEATKTYLDTRLEATKTSLEARLDARLEATKSEILKWMFGQTLVIIGAVLALSRFSH